MKNAPGLTAVQEILLAALDLTQGGKREFSEWDLTVAVWRRDANKFGCRGYEHEYPDHKRVMMEIMSREKLDNPLRKGWMEKTRANHYVLTALGADEAGRLSQTKGDTRSTIRSPADVYDAVIRFADHRVFKDYCKDSQEPRTWLGVEAFFGISKNEPTHVRDRIRAAESAVQQALHWLDESGRGELRRGSVGSGLTLRRQDLEKLRTFIQLLQDRFALQFRAILGE